MSAIDYTAGNNGVTVAIHTTMANPPEFKGQVLDNPANRAAQTPPTTYLQWEEWEHHEGRACIRRDVSVFLTREGLVALQKRVGEMIDEYDEIHPPAEG